MLLYIPSLNRSLCAKHLLTLRNASLHVKVILLTDVLPFSLEHLLSDGCKVKQACTPHYRRLQIPFHQLRLQSLPLDLVAS